MTLMLDLRHALRSLAAAPLFSATVVFTLALGFGVNAAVFSLVDAVMLRPLPFPSPEQLVAVAELPPTGVPNTVAGASYFHWVRAARSFDGLAARQATSLAVVGGAQPEEMRGARVSANYFEVLGLRPAYGRAFTDVDAAQGAACVVVLSHRGWQRLWPADPVTVGRTIRTATTTCEVVGVLPAGSVFDRLPYLLYQPLGFTETTAPRGHYLTVIGRLHQGVTLEQAGAEMRTIAGAFNASSAAKRDWSATVDPWRDTVVRAQSRQLVLVLFGAVALVLLVAVVNISSLSLSRATARRREVSVRMALGAGTGRLLRYFLVETAVLTMAGAAAGLALAAGALRLFVALMPAGTLPAELDVHLDARVLLFALVVVSVVTLVLGVLPAWQSRTTSAGEALRSGGRGSTGPAATRRVQHGLLIAQVAVAMMLVTGAAWLTVSFSRLSAVDPGFAPERVMTVRIALPGSPSAEQSAAIHGRLLTRLQSLAGVREVGAATSLPLQGWLYGTTVRVAGAPEVDVAQQNAHIQYVSGQYFDALGIRVKAGRTLSGRQGGEARQVVVNETFARRFIGDGDGVGRQVFLGAMDGGQSPWEVVGVIADLKTGGLADAALATPEVYVPHALGPAPSMNYVMRAPDRMPTEAEIRQAVAQVDAAQPVSAIRPMTQVIGGSLVTQKFRTALVGGFAVLALLVAVTGVYALRAQAVAARRREFGIRLALGATAGQVTRLVVAQGAAQVVAGLTLGAAGAWWASGAIEPWLFDVAVTDVAPAGVAVLLLGGSAIAASWWPARTAGRVSPSETLRADL